MAKRKKDVNSANEGIKSPEDFFKLAKSYHDARRYGRAATFYMKAADLGHAKAQNNLGLMHDKGQGVKTNKAEAVRYYLMAAKQNLPEAQNNLGVMYEIGEGVEKDLKVAVEWLTKAADQGYSVASFNLGSFHHEEGNQGRKEDRLENYSLAAKFFKAAVVGGHEQAIDGLKKLYDGVVQYLPKSSSIDFETKSGDLLDLTRDIYEFLEKTTLPNSPIVPPEHP